MEWFESFCLSIDSGFAWLCMRKLCAECVIAIDNPLLRPVADVNTRSRIWGISLIIDNALK